MYGITAKQKKALRIATIKFTKEKNSFPDTAEDLPEFDMIGDMNPCEVYWQYANRFVEDLRRAPEFSFINNGIFG